MRLLVVLALSSLGVLAAPVAASADVGASPFTPVAPANGSSTTDVRVTFAWAGQCPPEHECLLSMEATQLADPPRRPTGELDKYRLDDSYVTSTLAPFGPIGPGSARVESPFETPGVWYYHLVSSDTYRDANGKKVTDVHTSALTSFTVVPTVARLKMPVIASSERSRTMTFSVNFVGNVHSYDASFTAWVKRVAGGRTTWVKTWTKTVEVRTYIARFPGQSAKGTNYGRWDVPSTALLEKGAEVRVTAVIRATGQRKVLATKTRTVKLFVTRA
jgi:hypothetical protein